MQTSHTVTRATTGTVAADPGRILAISWGLAQAGTLVAALDIDLFGLIDRGVSTAPAIAAEQRISQRGVDALLLAVAALGLIVRMHDGAWALSSDAAMFLVPGKCTYLGDLRHLFRKLNFRIWPALTQAVQTGEPPQDLFDEQETDWAPVLSYLDTLGKPAALGIAQLLRERLGDAGLVLDVGCGAGVYGHTIATQLCASVVVAIDRIENIRVASARAAALGLSGRMQFKSGELRDMPWGGPYDAVVMSHLLHGYGVEAAHGFLTRAHSCLKPGGYLVINEFIPDEANPTRTPMQALFGLQMLLTSSGLAYGARQYSDWLREVGFREVRELAAPSGPSSYIVARR